MSPMLLRVSVDVRDDKYLRGQTPFSSVGDGYGMAISTVLVQISCGTSHSRIAYR